MYACTRAYDVCVLLLPSLQKQSLIDKRAEADKLLEKKRKREGMSRAELEEEARERNVKRKMVCEQIDTL